MPKLRPLQTLVLQRDGRRVEAPAGKDFNFTRAEIADIPLYCLDPEALAALPQPTGPADDMEVADLEEGEDPGSASPRPASPKPAVPLTAAQKKAADKAKGL